MEWWSYPTTFASNQLQLSKCATSASTEGFLTYINTSGVLKFNANSVSAWDIANDQGTIALKLNAWNHCAISRSGSSWRMWVNGASSVTITSALGVQNTSTAYSIAGAANGSAPFLGYINDTRIVIGSYVYDPASSTLTVPTAPLTAITNTSLLLSYTNAGIIDNAMMNDLETVGNAQISTSVKKYGTGSMYFDGSGDYLSSLASPNTTFGTGDFTIEMWLYAGNQAATSVRTMGNGGGSAWGSGKYIFTTYSGVGYKYQFNWWNYSSGTTDALVSTSASNTSTWTHIAITRSGNVFKMFVNGTQESTVTSSTSVDNGTPAQIRIGASGVSGDTEWAGYIDDLRITKYARYTANFTAPTTAFADKG